MLQLFLASKTCPFFMNYRIMMRTPRPEFQTVLIFKKFLDLWPFVSEINLDTVPTL